MATIPIGSIFAELRRSFSAFSRAGGGNVAVIFALAAVPVFGAVGAAVDYSRANSVKAAMQAALDATALTLSKEVAGLPPGQVAPRASALFAAMFHRPEARNVQIVPEFARHDGAFTLTISGSAELDASFVRLFGLSQLKVSALTQVVWGTKQLELALVLDNTGSMASSGKIEELKKAARNLLKTLQATTAGAAGVRVAIVPFDTNVNIGTPFRDAPWIDWSLNFDGDTTSSIPVRPASFGATSFKDSWTGCVVDREQPFDVQPSAPGANASTHYPAANCGLTAIQPLTADWKALERKVEQMKASGYTNLTIGLVWGWAMLSPDVPLSTAAAPAANRNKVMVFLTDGLNTRNRWSSNAREIDKRTRAVCQNIRQAGIRVYTIRVIEGNAALLKECATRPDMYFEVTQAKDIGTVFETIAQQLATIYIAR